ncbi:MAG: hypothetical protein U1E02_02300, partial [Hydrogenophaga sp.]|nr:hypothetical protein [Hydrogenophaga sp.]
PSRSSTNWRIASRAASKGYLLGSMQSSGMRHIGGSAKDGWIAAVPDKALNTGVGVFHHGSCPEKKEN